MKTLFFSSLIAMFLMSPASAQSSNHFPKVFGKDLNKKPWTAPAGFPAAHTLVLIGFEREAQHGIDSWLDGMEARNSSSRIPWIEMPVINNPGMLMRWFIDTGMRRGISDRGVRSHVWTAYTDKKAFMHACGMHSAKEVYALVVDRSGKILAMQAGIYSKQKATNLLRALHE